jgi:hypothetical protein
LGTQAKPQQSALVAQACPALEPPSLHGRPVIVQRGMPSRSCWQTSGFWLTLPAQQLFSALHELMASLQMAPAGRHAFPLSQRPTGSLGLPLLQFPTPVEPWMPPKPQQSESVLQISPVGRQPLGGWQTMRPERCGAHARLQHSPPHDGTPPGPPSATAPQATPATVHPGTPGVVGGIPQVPTVAPAALLQMPPQHSTLATQASPF